MIKRINKEEITSVHKITEEIVDYMDDNNIEQWEINYNLYKEIAYNIEKGNGFGYYKNRSLAGFCILNEINPINQSIEIGTECTMYVHFLIVHPQHHRQGIATKLIKHSEESIIDSNYASLSLLINAFNCAGQRFSESHNFSLTENIRFCKKLFHKYEKYSTKEYQHKRYMHFTPSI